ncbi:kiwellin-like [Argentina anserina]|uniref:kiwellin-like n=1 Tax=Argentina anserina TaxID=57926 RepID=UPI002176735C|nr:kiwellin-like [Potentilla anserina]
METTSVLLISLFFIFIAIAPTLSCDPSGSIVYHGTSFPIYTCSPPVTAPTGAKLTLNDFSKGGDGGDPFECDGQYHDNNELVVALSTGWYNSGSRCGSMITIAATNGASVMAKVVDECDSREGCNRDHGGQPPCLSNIVDGSPAVWNALGLDQGVGIVDVTWAMT